MQKPCELNGVKYESHTAAGRALGLSSSRIWEIVHNEERNARIDAWWVQTFKDNDPEDAHLMTQALASLKECPNRYPQLRAYLEGIES